MPIISKGKKINFKKFIISLALPQLAGIIGSFFTAPAVSNWYTTIQKPGFNPPNWVFGPVWVMLYILMGISVFLVWNEIEKNKKAKDALRLFWVHLFFNAVWSIIFFGFKSPALAFADIIIIWILVVILIFKFLKINKWASFLLAPYFFWLTFAAILNYFIWYLN